MKLQRNKALVALVVGTFTLAGCGASPTINRYKGSNDAEAKPGDGEFDTEHADGEGTEQEHTDHEEGYGQEIDHIVVPPKEYYDAVLKDTMANLDDQERFALQGGPDQVLFVNFAGARVAKGFGNGQSFILCNQLAEIPSPGLSPADQSMILDSVAKYFSDAGVRLNVVGTQPASGAFTTIHVGGSYSDLGCRGAGVLGVAPFDPGNVNPSDVGFAFTSGVQNNRIIAETIAHEAGHSFGLDHVDAMTDLMYFATSPNITGFGVGKVPGTGEVQDGPAVLRDVLGMLSTTPGSTTPIPLPTVTPSPTPAPIPGLPNLPGGLAGIPGLDMIGAIGGLLPGMSGAGAIDISAVAPILLGIAGGGSLSGIDQVLAIVGIASSAGQAQGGLPAGLPIDPALAASILGGLGGSGAGGFDITSLLGLAGLPDLGAGLDLISSLLGGVGSVPPSSGAGSLPPVAGVPDLASLLGLLGGSGAVGLPGIGGNPADLITNLIGTTRVVNGNYSGAQRDALISLLRVAYSQAYAQAQTPSN